MKSALVIAALASFAGAFFYGVHVGTQSNEIKDLTKKVKAVQSRGKINHAVKNLKHNTIVNELDAGGWLRDE